MSLTRPEFFTGYVIVSPSLLYHDRAMFALAEVVGSRHPQGLELRWDVAGGETHNSVFPRALGTGLRFVLGGR